MRYSRAFRWGAGRWAWEIRFAFFPRSIIFGVGWDEPDGAPWERWSLSAHLACFAMVVRRPIETVDPRDVVNWLAAHGKSV